MSPAASTLREEMAVGGRRLLAASVQNEQGIDSRGRPQLRLDRYRRLVPEAREPSLPTYKALLWPCLTAIAEDLHGSGQKAEIIETVDESFFENLEG